MVLLLTAAKHSKVLVLLQYEDRGDFVTLLITRDLSVVQLGEALGFESKAYLSILQSQGG